MVMSAVALGLAGCRRAAPEAHEGGGGAEPVAVRAEVLSPATAEAGIPLPGLVRAVERATLRAQVAGRVEASQLAVGSRVAAGAPLVTVEAPEWERRLEQARALVAELEGDRDREVNLLAGGVSTPEAVRSIRQRLAAAVAALQEIEVFHGYQVTTAPFAGVVVREHVRPGDWVAAGAPLADIEGVERFEVEVMVPAGLPGWPLGREMRWQERAGGGGGRARLAELAQHEDPLTRTRQARLSLAGAEGPRGGSLVTVQWPTLEAETRLWVAVAAVRRVGQVEQVFTLEDGRARLRWVRLGEEQAGQRAVLSGLRAGERVILNPAMSLRDGQRVVDES